MKKIVCFLLVAGLFPALHSVAQNGDDQKLGLPGDNLNLYAVMKLFQESPTLEIFEKKLNEEDNKINNLDLNGDDQIDYIRVTDQVEGKVHNIVLQVAVNEKETQDVAVFTVSKDDSGQVSIQLTGDEELYGKDYIIEPNVAEPGATPNPGYTGGAAATQTRKLDDKEIVVNQVSPAEINQWPIVQVIYVPTYSPWHSPYYWGHYPGWWRPWRPLYWDYYFGYHYNSFGFYWGWYRPWPHHRNPWWNDYYYRPHRSVSVTVNVYRNGGRYQNTYSRPDMRKQGMSDFTSRHPRQPVLRPGLNKPAPRPPVSRPSPGAGNATRPARPGTRPSNPGTRPNPAVRPGNPSTRPAPKPKPTQRPVTRPAPSTQRPSPAARPAPSTRPATRPSPAPRTGTPSKQPATRPVTRPGSN